MLLSYTIILLIFGHVFIMKYIFCMLIFIMASSFTFAQDNISTSDDVALSQGETESSLSNETTSSNFFDIGAKIGATFGMSYLKDFLSFRGGLVFEMPFLNWFGIQLNMTYSAYSVIFAGIVTTQPDNYNAIANAVDNKKTYVSYIDINPFLKFYIGPIWLGVGGALNLSLNGVGKQYAFDGSEGFETFDIVQQDTMSAFGIYFSLGGVAKLTDIIYLLPEAHLTVYPKSNNPYATEKTFRFLTSEWVVFGINIAVAFKVW